MYPSHCDKNFDPYVDKFQRHIYDSLKGKIRLKVLEQDLAPFLMDDCQKLNILDAGCGSGHCSSLLAQTGHHLTLCDISEKMLSFAKEIYQAKEINTAKFFHCSAQDFVKQASQQYDMILCHAVLEWIESPMELLSQLNQILKPGGYLSLIFFNLNGNLFRSVTRGNFYPKNNNFKFGGKGRLTPTHPLNPTDVQQWCQDLNLNIVDKSGMRVFYDYCEKEVRDNLDEEKVITCELSFSKTEPFLSMARYIHFLCQKEDQHASH